MLKSVKRSFDSTTTSTPDSLSYCSPRKIQFLDPSQQQQQPFSFAPISTSTTTTTATTMSSSSSPSFLSPSPLQGNTNINININTNTNTNINNTYSENTTQQQQQTFPTPSKKVRGISQYASTQLRPESPLAHFPYTTPTALLETVDHVARVRGVSDSNEKAFSVNDVRAILEHALKERDNHLRLEFDSILQSQLSEQFKEFAKFNEDYISRQLKESDFSYMS